MYWTPGGKEGQNLPREQQKIAVIVEATVTAGGVTALLDTADPATETHGVICETINSKSKSLPCS